MNEPLTPVRVWDLPTRSFHWLLAACIVASITSAKIGGNAMLWHFRFGYVVFTLLAFRLLWGLVGGRWSRFASFLYAPGTLWRYLLGRSRAGDHFEVGHTPLGAMSVFAILLLLAAQVGTGLFADDEISNAGPMVRFVSGATSNLSTNWHKNFGQWLIIGLVLLHIGAVLFYLLRKGQNLVRPMISGDKLLSASVPASVDNLRTRGAAVLLLAACAAGVAWLVSLGG